MAEVVDLIGVPFAYGGRGPDAFDCYGLLRELYRRDGKQVPDYTSPSDAPQITALIHSQLHLWERIETPERGSAVLLRAGSLLHVGYCMGGDKFAHTWERSGGVTVERLDTWKRHLVGYYRYIGD